MSTPFPLPELDFEPTRPFFEAAARGELAVPRCPACGAFCWYPADACRRCGQAPLEWKPVSGRGLLYSFAVVRRALVQPFADQVPYISGLVSLEEDPSLRIVTRVMDCEPESLRVEMPLVAAFRPLRFSGVEGEVIAPVFVPAG